ncbi:oxygenase MpaB family protein [Sphingomonas arenae]|uniref:oxygenase MpaB family protein n=1 Tax=Sphingomonas arenae TaxID=2812555 RepID=UPI001967B9D0|nr:oxygenase MpaB family protein [Sphingomonas arenae]
MSWLLSRIAGPLLARELVFPEEDFTVPAGEPAIVGPASVSWRVFQNPVSLAVGGITAVLLELGEPGVRSGVWDHSSFRRDPRERMRRTGLGAMITVYGARSRFEGYARRVNGIHRQVRGVTDAGEPYRADDPVLLRWVQATAAFGFVEAYKAYVAPLSAGEEDAFYDEASLGAALYGVADAPRSRGEMWALLAEMAPRLGPSPVLHEFLAIMRTGRILPGGAGWLQPLLARGALSLVPLCLRERLGLRAEPGLGRGGRALLRLAARVSGAIEVPDAPWSQAGRRLSPGGGGGRPRS